jgi:tetratricopeptide (TPR) repeat protein
MNTYEKTRGGAPSAAIALLSFTCALLCSSPVQGRPAPSGSSLSSLSQSPDSSVEQARSLLQEGKLDDADLTVRQFLARHPDSADAHFLLGHILFREIQAQATRQTASPSPSATTPGGLKTLGPSSTSASSRDEKARAALAEFTAGAKIRTPDASDLKTVALIYVVLGDYPDADKWLTKMLEWTPNDADGWYLLGRAKYNENRFAEAISAFQSSLKLDPANVKTEDNLGLSFAGLNRNEEAAAAYQQAIAWQEKSLQKDSDPYVDMGSLLLDENRNEDAIPFLKQAVELSPYTSKPHELLGQAYSRLNQIPLAQSELEKAIALSPKTASLHCMLGPIYRKQSFLDKAKIEFEQCASLNSEHTTPQEARP